MSGAVAGPSSDDRVFATETVDPGRRGTKRGGPIQLGIIRFNQNVRYSQDLSTMGFRYSRDSSALAPAWIV